MSALKNHWISGLSLVAVVFMLTTGAAMTITGGEFSETEVRVYGVAAVSGGLVALVGLWGLRYDYLGSGLAQAMIAAGMVVLAVGYWWFVFVPPVVAAAVLWAGVVRNGLTRELHPA